MMIQGRANELADFQVFRTVFSYCLVIITLPVITFFTAKYVVFDGLLKLESMPSNVYSAICSVIVLHLALGMYIYRAYSETDRSKLEKPVKKD